MDVFIHYFGSIYNKENNVFKDGIGVKGSSFMVIIMVIIVSIMIISTELLKSCFVAPVAFWRVKMWLQKQRDSRHKI